MAVAQAQNGPNAGGGNAAFQTFHQAFQRLQSQESQKLDQQRLGGLGLSQPQQPPQQPNGGNNQAQQQQFLQMMQQAGLLQNNQGSNGQGGLNFANMMAAQGQSQTQGQPQGQINLGNLAAQMGNIGQNAFNIHSQQQGLSLPGMPDNEQGRRQMLQK
jgi:hypothetical protein